MTDTLTDTATNTEPSTAASTGRSRLLPVMVVMSLPVIFAAWWFLSGPTDNDAAQDAPAAASDDPDPWRLIRRPIFPMGRIEQVHHTSEFTYILFRGEDRDRWVAISPTKFEVGDVVQLRVDPRAVKTDFRVKQLGRIFPTLVLAGQAKLIRSADD